MAKRLILLLVLVVGVPWLDAKAANGQSLTVASFNIKWLGNYKDKDSKALTGLLKDLDIVLVQELVAPPYQGNYPNNKPFKPTQASKEFFDFMTRAGFKYILSEENTGRNRNRINGSAAEWFVAFYKPEVVCAAGQEPAEASCDASDLPNGFLAKKRALNANYDRVPYAFGFRAVGGKADFVIISVHLRPSTGSENKARRKQELKAVGKWISENSDKEKHFLIVGDMNMYNCEELENAKPAGYFSLNSSCATTVTGKTPRPYDHVLVPKAHDDILHRGGAFKTIDLVQKMCAKWDGDGPCPGKPYESAAFGKYYSDHRPVLFELSIASDSDSKRRTEESNSGGGRGRF